MDAQQLMRLLNFDEADLQTNRNGHISEKQNARLQKMEASAKKMSLLGCAGNFLVALIGVGGAFAMMGNALDFGVIIFVFIFGILWPLLWGSAGFLGLRRAFAKVEATLKKAEGSIVIEKTVRSSYDSDSHVTTRQNVYELRVGGYTFIVSPALQNYMKRGDFYTVYFAGFNHKERSKEILSVELMTKVGGASASETVPADDVEVVEYVKRGDIMGAIRMHRSIHGSGFEDAKAVVDDIKSRLG